MAAQPVILNRYRFLRSSIKAKLAQIDALQNYVGYDPNWVPHQDPQLLGSYLDTDLDTLAKVTTDLKLDSLLQMTAAELLTPMAISRMAP